MCIHLRYVEFFSRKAPSLIKVSLSMQQPENEINWPLFLAKKSLRSITGAKILMSCEILPYLVGREVTPSLFRQEEAPDLVLK